MTRYDFLPVTIQSRSLSCPALGRTLVRRMSAATVLRNPWPAVEELLWLKRERDSFFKCRKELVTFSCLDRFLLIVVISWIGHSKPLTRPESCHHLKHLRDYWQPFAIENLTTFAKDDSNAVLKMLKDYGGFDSLTQDKVDNIRKNFQGTVGEIQSIKPSDASCSEGRWTYLFDVLGSKQNAIGSVVFFQSSFTRRLSNIGVNPVEK